MWQRDRAAAHASHAMLQVLQVLHPSRTSGGSSHIRGNRLSQEVLCNFGNSSNVHMSRACFRTNWARINKTPSSLVLSRPRAAPETASSVHRGVGRWEHAGTHT
eukprot:5147291-Prymnesium_polylepis.2